MARKAKGIVLSERETYLIDSYILNGNEDMLYELFNPNSKADKFNKHRLALRFLHRKEVQAYIVDRKIEIAKMYAGAVIPNDGELDLTRKSDVVAVLSDLIKEEPKGSTRIQALKVLSDILALKQEDKKEDTELVHFYLPITCKRCSLYMEAKKKKLESGESEKEI